MNDLKREIAAIGYDVELVPHGQGFKDMAPAIDAFERLGPMPLAPRIEHFGLPSPAQIARARALGAVVVPQPIFVKSLGINFRAYSGTFSRNYTSLRSYRSSLSYVPGSHAIKVGMTLQAVWSDEREGRITDILHFKPA